MATNNLIQLIVSENPQTLVTSSFLPCLLVWSDELPRAEFPFSILWHRLRSDPHHLSSGLQHSSLIFFLCLCLSIISNPPSHWQPVSFKNTNRCRAAELSFEVYTCSVAWLFIRLSTIQLWCPFPVSILPLLSMYSMLPKYVLSLHTWGCIPLPGMFSCFESSILFFNFENNSLSPGVVPDFSR